MPLDDVSIVVVLYRMREPVTDLQTWIANGAEVIVADNYSLGSRHAIPLEAVVIDMGSNVGFAVAGNQAVRRSTRDYVLFLNPDCRADVSTVVSLLSVMRQDCHIAGVGPRTENPGGAEGSAGYRIAVGRAIAFAFCVAPLLPRAALTVRGSTARLAVDWLSGACLLLRRSAFVALRGFDERFFLYQEDLDLGIRLRNKGWHMTYLGDVVVSHMQGSSGGNRTQLDELRGRALKQVIHKHAAGKIKRQVIIGLFVAGYSARSVLQRLGGPVPETVDYRAVRTGLLGAL